MARDIEIVGIPKQEPNTQLYVLALITLARQLQEEEAAKTAENEAVVALEPPSPQAEADDD